MNLQRHQEVVNSFMKRVFKGALKPGDKLPTEKQLTEEMNVDRGSLRVGLKQLESMGILDIRHGDGMYVQDYVRSAGIDFLRTLFQFPEPDGQELVVDQYLIDEMWEFWALLFPPIVKLATEKYSNRDLRAIMGLLEEEEKCIPDRERIVDLEVRSHDMIVEIIDNTIIMLLFNSCRPLRRKMVRIQIERMNDDDLREHIRTKRALLKRLVSSTPEEIDDGIELFRERLQSYRQEMRKSFDNNPDAI